jgi:cysteine desulfurase / selenocysteine lyase
MGAYIRLRALNLRFIYRNTLSVQISVIDEATLTTNQTTCHMQLAKIRKDTVGCADKLFLNSAGASLMPKSVIKIMKAYLKEEEQFGGYEVAAKNADQVTSFYTELGKLLNCATTNIAFMFNATDAYSKALSAIPFSEGDSILTTNDDYISNYIAFLSLQKRFGIKIVRSKNLPNGDLDLVDFERLILKHRPKLVSLTHIPTNSGLIQDAQRVGALCAQYDIWYLLDACQSVGQIVVDVKQIKCDFLSATGRKFLRGPRGTGFLYISDKALNAGLEPLFIDMRGAKWTSPSTYEPVNTAKRFEEWEVSYASLFGLAEAVRYANAIGIDKVQEYNSVLAQSLRTQLSQVPNISVLDKGTHTSNIITFHMAGIELESLSQYLKSHGVRFSISMREHAIIDLTDKQVDWVIRFSPHYFNTMEEIDQVVQILRQVKS